MAQHAHAKKPNYRNIVLAGVIIVLIIVMAVLLMSSCGKKKPEPVPAGSEASRVSDNGSVYGSEEESSSEQSSEESSSGSSESSESSSSSSSKSESSSSSSSSSSGDTPTGKYAAMPETPYSYDTTGKSVRNAFDANGEVDLLFPINSTYYITRNFKVAKLEKVDGDYKMDYRAAPHCKEMLAAMRTKLNSDIRAFSTYRSYEYQEGNFQRKVNKLINKGYSKTDAYNTAATIVAIPGTSEHQLGLAIDVYLDSLYNKYGELNEHFEETKEYKWLQEHAWEYGFILSYPKDKIKDTGIIYEPWHYRYVGVENAKAIRDSGMLLVQWLESQNIVYVYNGK
ncbi:MAG: M15 family metallopeptidase [Clostridia bacterium]|nr:M15 family metallopeptidase [Clostridia bacterium]